jgi:hypothetical protein
MLGGGFNLFMLSHPMLSHPGGRGNRLSEDGFFEKIPRRPVHGALSD